MSKHKKQLKSYKFYFLQVNQECVEVKSFSVRGAFRKAEKDWMSRNKYPLMVEADVLESGTWKKL